MLVADPHSPDFNSYASVSDLRAFAAGRGYSIPADDDECGQMLMQAMDFLEGKAWRGQRYSASQPLSSRVRQHRSGLHQRAYGIARKKLRQVAAALYTPGPTLAELSAFGLTPEDVEDEVGILPSIWEAFTVFSALATQWRVGASGATGLDYNVLPWVFELHGVEDAAACMADIRIMESEALKVMHKETA